jgi:ABC-type transport system substrate-binding protein
MHNPTVQDQGPRSAGRLSPVRRMLVFSVVVGVAFMASACGGATPTAQKSTAVTPEPLIVAQAPTAIAVTDAQTPEVVAQDQAVQLGAFEEQYATCFTYAALDQSLVGNTGIANAPVVQSCSTTGLTQAEVHEIQDLIVRAS